MSGFLLYWDSKYVDQFVETANTEKLGVAKPTWMTDNEAPLTHESFVKDLLSYLAEVAGGIQYESNLLTPNTPLQMYEICRRLGHIEMHPFMQACMAKLPEDASLASTMRLYENPTINACPIHFSKPPAPFRQLFF